MRNRFFFTLALAVLLAACQTTRPDRPEALPTTPQAPDEAFEFIIVQLNDVYEISGLDGGSVGGMARVATVLKQLKEKNPNTLAILSGDFISPSLISSLKQGETPVAGKQMVAAMNAVGIDYVTFGNHEFDVSETSLQARIDESDFGYFSGNVLQQTVRAPGDTLRAPFRQRGTPIPEYASHTFQTPRGQQVRLGLIGVTLPFNKKPYVYYKDIYTEGMRTYEAARAGHDLIFGITHLAIDEDRALARRLPDLPFIMGGHEHEDMLVIEGNTRITKADANARTVYIHWITYHTGTGAVDIWSQLMPITEDIPADPSTKAVVDGWEQQANQAIREMGYDPTDDVAQFSEPYDGREASIRNEPTNLGRAIACAMLAEDPTAAFAFLNSGSIRVDDQLEGKISQRDVLRMLPFGGAIVQGRFKGNLLQRILDIGLGQDVYGSGAYLQITPNVQKKNDGTYEIDARPLDPNGVYEAVVPQFLSDGGEDVLSFMKDDPSIYTALNLQPRNDLRDVTIKYLKSKPENWETCAN